MTVESTRKTLGLKIKEIKRKICLQQKHVLWVALSAIISWNYERPWRKVAGCTEKNFIH
jgi:hypothetical protein